MKRLVFIALSLFTLISAACGTSPKPLTKTPETFVFAEIKLQARKLEIACL